MVDIVYRFKKLIGQFCRIRKDCDHNGDRMSKKNEKLPYLPYVTKEVFS